jgi:glycosyltransferase involved in cell wall biosynthesis
MPGPASATAPRRRVYHVIARLNIGGPAVHVALLASRLPAPYDPTILAGEVGPEEGDMAYYARERGVEPLFVEGLGRDLKPLRDLWLVWWLYRVFRRERPMIVHTHTAKAGAVGRLAAWLAGVPVVVHTFHGHVLRGYFGLLKTRLFGFIERTLARVTDCIITLGETQRGEILSMGIGQPDSVVAIPLGLDLDEYFAVVRGPGALQRELGLPAETRLVGIVARLVPIKRHEVFLEAAKKIAERDPAVRFVIVGDGERRAAVEEKIRELGLGDRVHILGWKKQLAPVYADLAVLALSSANEGLPTAVIEAQAAATPVVSTNVGSVGEVVADGVSGHLVPVEDPGAMAERILAVLADADGAARMGERGRERMRARYGVDRLVGDIERLYGTLLSRKGLGAA